MLPSYALAQGIRGWGSLHLLSPVGTEGPGEAPEGRRVVAGVKKEGGMGRHGQEW